MPQSYDPRRPASPDGGDATPSGAPVAAFNHPTHLACYRILQVLGEGGMGVVYEAEQKEPIQRRVALKVVRSEVASREVLARFDQERQALAVMSHDSIAKVLDAGTSEAGQPFFAMELVRGVPITEYCDAHLLSIRERIALFIPVCQGVQHAHQKGVIHRDLKPSNVLVTEVDGRPLPKIIDFGIAKAIGQHLTAHTLVTLLGQALGTPAYMSPEQAEMSGLDVDTRTDIFSLGVMLFELLVGRLPDDPEESGLAGFLMRRAYQTEDVVTPSRKLQTLGAERVTLAKLRSTDPEGLRHQLRGDLDWIVMKAMEPDRNRRYETVNGLANDLARFLAHEPVQARPATPSYRVRKFVRRHRVSVLAVAAIFLALVGGAAAATVGFLRARRAELAARQEAATATQVSDFLSAMFRVSKPERARGSSITARELLDSGAARIDTQLARTPVVQARLQTVMGDAYDALGFYPQAESLLTRALRTREGLGGRESDDAAITLAALGRVYRAQARYAPAESALVHALWVFDHTRPPDSTARTDALFELAELYRLQGKYAPADSLSHRALALLEPRYDSDNRQVIRFVEMLGMLAAEQGRPIAAESLFRRVLVSRERAERATGATSSDVAVASTNLANALFEQNKLSEAESLYRRALQIQTRVYGPEHPAVGLATFNLANLLSARGDQSGAIALFEQAGHIFETKLGPQHPYVAAALVGAGSAWMEAGRPEHALPLLKRSLAIREKTLEPGHPFIATSQHALGEAYLALHRFPEAEAELDSALAIRRKSLDATSAYTAKTLGRLADVYRETGRPVQAERYYKEALATFDASKDTDAKARAQIAKGYAALLRQTGRAMEAAAMERAGTPGH